MNEKACTRPVNHLACEVNVHYPIPTRKNEEHPSNFYNRLVLLSVKCPGIFTSIINLSYSSFHWIWIYSSMHRTNLALVISYETSTTVGNVSYRNYVILSLKVFAFLFNCNWNQVLFHTGFTEGILFEIWNKSVWNWLLNGIPEIESLLKLISFILKR